jgi:xanthine dehydrogenase molybdopterin-binding subunit B
VAIQIRKWATFREEILTDGERELAEPLRRVAVAAVCSNPYAGRWSDDLGELIDFGEYLGEELTRRCQEALGEPVEAFGKGGIVGEHGELAGGVRRIGEIGLGSVGRAINPMLVEGQIHGGIAQGLGLALMESYEAGRTDNLHDYLIPTFGDIPPIEVHIVEDAEPAGPFGAKGVGEPALIPTAPAILGASRDAIGVRIDRVPATPSRVLEAIAAKRGGR